MLVVDDHAGFRATARRMLEADGWQVVGEAADGASAIAEFGRLRPDVVLLDVVLPDHDGFVVAERLAGLAGAQVVLVSSRERAAYGDRVESSLAVGFIGKGELDGDALRRLLDTQREGRE